MKDLNCISSLLGRPHHPEQWALNYDVQSSNVMLREVSKEWREIVLQNVAAGQVAHVAAMPAVTV